MTDSSDAYAEIWRDALDSLDLTSRDRAFVQQARLLGLLPGTAIVEVPDDATKNVVETRVRRELGEALSARIGETTSIAVTAVSYTHLDVYKRQPQGGQRVSRAGRVVAAALGKERGKQPLVAQHQDLQRPGEGAAQPAGTCLLYTSRCV